MPNQNRIDAQEELFFKRQLESVKAKIFETKYPQLRARTLFPTDFSVDTGAQSLTYRRYDKMGIAKVIANYANDLPAVDIKGEEKTAYIRSMGDHYGYSIQDIRSARMAGVPLEQRKANAARRAMLQLENQIAFYGDSSHNLQGFLNNPNIPVSSVPADGIGASTKFKDKTPDQIIRDISDCINDVKNNTKGVESPNTLLLPIEQYSYIQQKRLTDTGSTVMKFIRENHPGIEFMEVNEMKGAGTNGSDIMVAYYRHPDALQLIVPQEFEQFPPQLEGLYYKVPCHQRIGGVIVYLPLSINICEGI